MENEKRLIDPSAFLRTLEWECGDVCEQQEYSDHLECEVGFSREAICKLLQKAPAVDAAVVVRCKDCKHSSCNPVKLTYACNHPSGLRGFINEGFYFCSHGEKR